MSGLSIANNTLLDPTTGKAFPNNVNPTNKINPSAQALLRNDYPVPNIGTGGNTFNYENLESIPSSTNGLDLRVDHAITQKQQVEVRFSWKNLLTNVANPLLPNDVDQEHDRSLLVSHNYAMTPRLLNEFRYGFTRSVIALNFGLRWTALPAFTEQIGDLGNFDPRMNSVIVPDNLLLRTKANPGLVTQYLEFQQSFNACTLPQINVSLPCTNVLTASQAHLSQGLRQLYLGNYQPRISAAFRPFHDNKTVLRAGFGIFTVTNLGRCHLTTPVTRSRSYTIFRTT